MYYASGIQLLPVIVDRAAFCLPVNVDRAAFEAVLAKFGVASEAQNFFVLSWSLRHKLGGLVQSCLVILWVQYCASLLQKL